MLKKLSLPPYFSLVRKGRIYLLLHEKYKDFLLEQGIEDLEAFLKKNQQEMSYVRGRTCHPSIPLQKGERLILRQYSHGGLLRSITRNLYLFGSRSFQELALTQEIRSSGIQTIQPMGAIHRILFPPLYQAYLLSLEIPHAEDLIQYLKRIGPHPADEKLIHKRTIIRSAGHLLQKFHRAGFFHGDLQLKNILATQDRIFLIDFDRSYRKSALSMGERMNNLLRLYRSVKKWRRLGVHVTRTDCWRFFLAYAGDDKKIREEMKGVLQNYLARSLLFRLVWSFERIVRR